MTSRNLSSSAISARERNFDISLSRRAGELNEAEHMASDGSLYLDHGNPAESRRMLISSRSVAEHNSNSFGEPDVGIDRKDGVEIRIESPSSMRFRSWGGGRGRGAAAAMRDQDMPNNTAGSFDYDSVPLITQISPRQQRISEYATTPPQPALPDGSKLYSGLSTRSGLKASSASSSPSRLQRMDLEISQKRLQLDGDGDVGEELLAKSPSQLRDKQRLLAAGVTPPRIVRKMSYQHDSESHRPPRHKRSGSHDPSSSPPLSRTPSDYHADENEIDDTGSNASSVSVNRPSHVKTRVDYAVSGKTPQSRVRSSSKTSTGGSSAGELVHSRRSSGSSEASSTHTSPRRARSQSQSQTQQLQHRDNRAVSGSSSGGASTAAAAATTTVTPIGLRKKGQIDTGAGTGNAGSRVRQRLGKLFSRTPGSASSAGSAASAPKYVSGDGQGMASGSVYERALARRLADLGISPSTSVSKHKRGNQGGGGSLSTPRHYTRSRLDASGVGAGAAPLPLSQDGHGRMRHRVYDGGGSGIRLGLFTPLQPRSQLNNVNKSATRAPLSRSFVSMLQNEDNGAGQGQKYGYEPVVQRSEVLDNRIEALVKEMEASQFRKDAHISSLEQELSSLRVEYDRSSRFAEQLRAQLQLANEYYTKSQETVSSLQTTLMSIAASPQMQVPPTGDVTRMPMPMTMPMWQWYASQNQGQGQVQANVVQDQVDGEGGGEGENKEEIVEVKQKEKEKKAELKGKPKLHIDVDTSTTVVVTPPHTPKHTASSSDVSETGSVVAVTVPNVDAQPSKTPESEVDPYTEAFLKLQREQLSANEQLSTGPAEPMLHAEDMGIPIIEVEGADSTPVTATEEEKEALMAVVADVRQQNAELTVQTDRNYPSYTTRTALPIAALEHRIDDAWTVVESMGHLIDESLEQVYQSSEDAHGFITAADKECVNNLQKTAAELMGYRNETVSGLVEYKQMADSTSKEFLVVAEQTDGAYLKLESCMVQMANARDRVRQHLDSTQITLHHLSKQNNTITVALMAIQKKMGTLGTKIRNDLSKIEALQPDASELVAAAAGIVSSKRGKEAQEHSDRILAIIARVQQKLQGPVEGLDASFGQANRMEKKLNQVVEGLKSMKSVKLDEVRPIVAGEEATDGLGRREDSAMCKIMLEVVNGCEPQPGTLQTLSEAVKELSTRVVPRLVGSLRACLGGLQSIKSSEGPLFEENLFQYSTYLQTMSGYLVEGLVEIQRKSTEAESTLDELRAYQKAHFGSGDDNGNGNGDDDSSGVSGIRDISEAWDVLRGLVNNTLNALELMERQLSGDSDDIVEMRTAIQERLQDVIDNETKDSPSILNWADTSEASFNEEVSELPQVLESAKDAKAKVDNANAAVIEARGQLKKWIATLAPYVEESDKKRASVIENVVEVGKHFSQLTHTMGQWMKSMNSFNDNIGDVRSTLLSLTRKQLLDPANREQVFTVSNHLTLFKALCDREEIAHLARTLLNDVDVLQESTDALSSDGEPIPKLLKFTEKTLNRYRGVDSDLSSSMLAASNALRLAYERQSEHGKTFSRIASTVGTVQTLWGRISIGKLLHRLVEVHQATISRLQSQFFGTEEKILIMRDVNTDLRRELQELRGRGDVVQTDSAVASWDEYGVRRKSVKKRRKVKYKLIKLDAAVEISNFDIESSDVDTTDNGNGSRDHSSSVTRKVHGMKPSASAKSTVEAGRTTLQAAFKADEERSSSAWQSWKGDGPDTSTGQGGGDASQAQSDGGAGQQHAARAHVVISNNDKDASDSIGGKRAEAHTRAKSSMPDLSTGARRGSLDASTGNLLALPPGQVGQALPGSLPPLASPSHDRDIRKKKKKPSLLTRFGTFFSRPRSQSVPVNEATSVTDGESSGGEPEAYKTPEFIDVVGQAQAQSEQSPDISKTPDVVIDASPPKQDQDPGSPQRSSPPRLLKPETLQTPAAMLVAGSNANGPRTRSMSQIVPSSTVQPVATKPSRRRRIMVDITRETAYSDSEDADSGGGATAPETQTADAPVDTPEGAEVVKSMSRTHSGSSHVSVTDAPGHIEAVKALLQHSSGVEIDIAQYRKRSMSFSGSSSNQDKIVLARARGRSAERSLRRRRAHSVQRERRERGETPEKQREKETEKRRSRTPVLPVEKGGGMRRRSGWKPQYKAKEVEAGGEAQSQSRDGTPLIKIDSEDVVGSVPREAAMAVQMVNAEGEPNVDVDDDLDDEMTEVEEACSTGTAKDMWRAVVRQQRRDSVHVSDDEGVVIVDKFEVSERRDKYYFRQASPSPRRSNHSAGNSESESESGRGADALRIPSDIATAVSASAGGRVRHRDGGVSPRPKLEDLLGNREDLLIEDAKKEKENREKEEKAKAEETEEPEEEKEKEKEEEKPVDDDALVEKAGGMRRRQGWKPAFKKAAAPVVEVSEVEAAPVPESKEAPQTEAGPEAESQDVASLLGLGGPDGRVRTAYSRGKSPLPESYQQDSEPDSIVEIEEEKVEKEKEKEEEKPVDDDALVEKAGGMRRRQGWKPAFKKAAAPVVEVSEVEAAPVPESKEAPQAETEVVSSETKEDEVSNADIPVERSGMVRRSGWKPAYKKAVRTEGEENNGDGEEKERKYPSYKKSAPSPLNTTARVSQMDGDGSGSTVRLQTARREQLLSQMDFMDD